MAKTKQEKTKDSKPNIEEKKFSKAQLLSSKLFKDRKDALGAVLEDNNFYSIDEAEKLYKEFMEGEVH